MFRNRDGFIAQGDKDVKFTTLQDGKKKADLSGCLPIF